MRLLAFALALLALTSPVSAQGTSSQQLAALLRDDWEYRLREYPELATHLGDPRYNNRLTDWSPAAIARRLAFERDLLARARTIDAAGLEGQERISLELYLWEREIDVEGQRFPTWLMPVDQLGGIQVGFPQLISSMPYRNASDYDNYLARLAAFPALMRQVIGLAREGIAKGWVQPPYPLRGVPAQIDGQLVADPEQSPLFAPVDKLPADLSAEDRLRITNGALKLIADSVIPSFREFQRFVRDEYLPRGRKQLAATSLPDGQAYYTWQIRRHTTLPLTAREVHETGLREVKRIRLAMDSVQKAAGFTGTFPEFLTFLRTDPRFYYTKPEDLLAGYRDIAKRIDGELPKLFLELPRTPYGIRKIPDYEAPSQTTAYYMPSAADGSRAGFFYANTYKLETRPKYEMEALTVHEAMPGHHLQIARAQELGKLPEFRRNGGYTAYVEGWGLYAESLGPELGLYTDPYSRFGQLTYEMWRACRLVIDTGIHAYGWSRDSAIAYLLANSAKTPQDAAVEIDRYIIWPGQALAYKIGELKMQELKREAKETLGPRFDIRRFHNAMLDNGPLPLTVLEREMKAWIAREAKRDVS